MLNQTINGDTAAVQLSACITMLQAQLHTLQVEALLDEARLAGKCYAPGMDQAWREVGMQSLPMLQVLINHTQPIPALAAYSPQAAFVASSQILLKG